MKLHISETLSLPIDAVTQTFAVLGIRGSGKTNTAKVLAEEMLKQGQQIVALDPTDAWYGIRSSKDGKSEGFKVYVFGGDHGDLPLGAEHGAELARFVIETGASAVFSMRHLGIAEQKRFAADFGETLRNLKSQPAHRNTPLHVFLDEAEEFIPQNLDRDRTGHVARMFGAYNRMVRRDRNIGLGITIISQRPQSVNKEPLSQIETLICHRLLHKLDRKAVKESWVEGHDVGDRAAEFLDSLAGLNKGDTWVWSPEWLDIFKRVHIREAETFDSSRTPKAGEAARTVEKLAPVDLSALKERLAKVVEEAKADDPKELRKQLAELQRQLKTAPAFRPDQAFIEEIRVEAKRNTELEISRAIRERDAEWFDLARKFQEESFAAMERLSQEMAGVRLITMQTPAAWTGPKLMLPAYEINPKHIPPVTMKPRSEGATTMTQHRVQVSDSNGHLPPGEKAILIAAAQFGGVVRDQLSVLTGYKKSSRDAYILRLSTKGYIVQSEGKLCVTEEGRNALGSDFEPLPTGEKLREYWFNRLPEGECKILKVLIRHGGRPVDRDSLDGETGYKKSSRDAYLLRLRARRLVEDAGRGQVQAVDNLFGF